MSQSSFFDTQWSADSVEFCPHPDATDIFVCGTYQLQQDPRPEVEEAHPADDDLAEEDPYPILDIVGKPQTRLGKCLVFETSYETDEFKNIQEFPLPAILDMKWCFTTQSRSPLLAIADAEGQVSLHDWDLEARSLKQSSVIKCAEQSVLCLSLDWSNRRNPTDTMGSLVVSLSNGKLALLQPNPDTGLTVTDTWHAHDYEPWVAAWDYWHTDTIYSGGDDLKLKVWDIRQGFEKPATVNKRFEAGITSIQSHPHVEHIFAVGSYDNTVRLFDSRKLLTPLTQADVHGGAWRVKWHPDPNRQHDLLVAAMHSGFKVRQPPIGEKWQIAKSYDEHESLAYGVDWSYRGSESWGKNGSVDEEGRGNTLIASCSFYDHALRTWRG
ncbi:WD-40 repeat-containing protein [Stereum hirsutum FP-91666 SS1]|uniref:WD-40 repeat-containing protein n=1 Tax=Stereum hirsutum (strain FP-91666) TaxID=721885 RepID=UPI0004449285|nr:WD-40 repeat-containing protein [Stereum hirsutum FP-91666 SS1]EIM83306.1 WD-40 repeat-containing protein [Stereum hirsutum FP-91666 SS1]